MSDTVKTAHKGRKFMVLIACIPMWLIMLATIVFLYIKFQSLPDALGFSFLTMTSVFPGYLGVNVFQKAMQGKIQGGS